VPRKSKSTAREESQAVRGTLRAARSQEERRAILNSIAEHALDWAHDCVAERESKGTAAASAMYEWAALNLDKMGGRGAGRLDVRINNVDPASFVFKIVDGGGK